MEAITGRLEAIAGKLQAIAGKLETIDSRLEAIDSRLEDSEFNSPPLSELVGHEDELPSCSARSGALR